MEPAGGDFWAYWRGTTGCAQRLTKRDGAAATEPTAFKTPPNEYQTILKANRTIATAKYTISPVNIATTNARSDGAENPSGSRAKRRHRGKQMLSETAMGPVMSLRFDVENNMPAL
jgi:hypothetical protein